MLNLFDFSKPATAERFFSVNDRVMGGVSSGRLVFDPQQRCALFEGTVSLENGGGFASVRSRPQQVDVTGCRCFVVNAAGDSKRYKFRVKTDQQLDGINYELSFESTPEPRELLLPFADFQPVFRGKVVAGASPFSATALWSFGFMIAGKQMGPFRLNVYSVHAA